LVPPWENLRPSMDTRFLCFVFSTFLRSGFMHRHQCATSLFSSGNSFFPGRPLPCPVFLILATGIWFSYVLPRPAAILFGSFSSPSFAFHFPIGARFPVHRFIACLFLAFLVSLISVRPQRVSKNASPLPPPSWTRYMPALAPLGMFSFLVCRCVGFCFTPCDWSVCAFL